MGNPLPWGGWKADAQEEKAPWEAGADEFTRWRAEEPDVQEGERLELKWTISTPAPDGEEEDSTEQWWGATVSRRLEELYHERRVFELEHDYDESFGPERSRVCFLSSCWLFDISPYFGSLMWRREGCDQTLRPSDLAPTGEENREVEEETNQLLESLPPDKQRKVAADFSDFLTTVKNGIARIANKRGSEHVVTESEVREVCSNAKKAQRTDDA